MREALVKIIAEALSEDKPLVLRNEYETVAIFKNSKDGACFGVITQLKAALVQTPKVKGFMDPASLCAWLDQNTHAPYFYVVS